MGVIDKDWFEPARLFDEGYPQGLTSALKALPAVRQVVRAEIAELAPELTLEIGPGDTPVTDGLPGVVFLDVAPVFLRPLAGARVIGDLFAAPFADAAFDLVVAADVLTHVRPGLRGKALQAIARLASAFLVFNPEPGTGQVADSPVPTRPIAAFFAARGMRVTQRKFVAMTPGGEYVMRLVKAVR